MKEKLKNMLKKILKMVKKEWIPMLILTLILLDIGYVIYKKNIYNADASVVQYRKLNAIVSAAENNASVGSMYITELIDKVSEDTKVYFLKEGKENISVVAQDAHRTMVVKHVPSLSMMFTIESKLLDKKIAYEWVEKREAPKSFIFKLLDVKYLNLLLLGGFMYFFMYTSGIKLFQKEFSSKKPEEIEGNFSDLIGYEDIKAEAKQLQYIITQKEKYAKYGIEGTFNILFSGKAGTGKSKFALYLAKELNVPIVSSTGSLDEVYVGTGARKIRNLFKEAGKQAEASEHNSCILFIDEGQNLLRTRGRKADNKWEDDTANELLAHLDGVEKSSKHNIIVIIASNFHENNLEMDAAMLRRFKKKIHFREPNFEERKSILLHYLGKIEKKEKNIDVMYLAKNMSGLTPAMIESVVQEAGLMALREKRMVDTEVLLKAFERMVVGQSSRALTQGEEKVRRVVTVHELGHFLVEYHRAVLLSDGDKEKVKEHTQILKISSESIAQIGALGFAMREQDETMMLKSVEDLEWEIKQLYGGIAAEQMVYGKSGHTTGSTDDIKRATKLLQHLIIENSVYSLSKLNYDVLGSAEDQLQSIESKSKLFYEESMRIVEEYEGLLLYLSGVLMAEWSLSKDEIFEYIDNYKNTKRNIIS